MLMLMHERGVTNYKKEIQSWLSWPPSLICLRIYTIQSTHSNMLFHFFLILISFLHTHAFFFPFLFLIVSTPFLVFKIYLSNIPQSQASNGDSFSSYLLFPLARCLMKSRLIICKVGVSSITITIPTSFSFSFFHSLF